MPFTADETAKRQAALDEAARKKEQERLEKIERERRETERLERLKRKYPDLSAYELDTLWQCAVELTNRLVRQYTDGELVLKADTLTWEVTLTGGGMRSYYDRREQSSIRLNILGEIARDHNDIGQTFSFKPVGNSELVRGKKSRDPQVRVTCTAEIPA